MIMNMKSFSFLSVLAILLAVSAANSITAYAAPGDQKIYDNYGLFTDEEAAALEESCIQYGEEGKVDIVIVTEDGLNGKTRKKYMEDFYDEKGFGYESEFGSSVILLINMDSGDRGVEIQGYGDAEYYVNDDRIEHILDGIVPMLSRGKYYKAMLKFTEETAYYMNQTDFGKYYFDPDSIIFFNIFFQLGAAAVIGGVAVGIMAFNSGGRVTVNNYTYLDEQNSGVVAHLDDFIRTTTTRVRKPSNNSGGGRSSGGGGISAGGHSHSGGGRSF